MPTPAHRAVLTCVISLVVLATACAPAAAPTPAAAPPKAAATAPPAKPEAEPAAKAPRGLPRTLSIATHPKGSLLNTVGSGFATTISTHLPIVAKDQPFTGYLTWVPLLNKGEVEMGIITGFETWLGYNGRSPYKENATNLRLLSGGSPLRLTYIARMDSGIESIADLRGKRVTIDNASETTRIGQETVLRANGVDTEKDVTVVPVAGVVDTVRALQEGRADGVWGTPGQAQLREAISRIGPVRWLSVAPSEDSPGAKTITDAMIGTRILKVTPGMPTVENEALVLAHPIYLLTHKDVSDETAYQTAKLIWEKQQDLVKIHGIFREWTHEAMVAEDAVIAYHPGAVRFYKEVKAWSDEMEKRQKSLLGS